MQVPSGPRRGPTFNNRWWNDRRSWNLRTTNGREKASPKGANHIRFCSCSPPSGTIKVCIDLSAGSIPFGHSTRGYSHSPPSGTVECYLRNFNKIKKQNFMKLGLLQLHITADIADNKTRLAEGIIDLAKRGAELIVLQELHNSLYFCQVEDVENFNLAEPIPGPSTEFYGKLAKDLGVVIVTSLFERRAPGLYHNTAVVIEKDGTIAGKYRKMHIPDDPAYYEKFYFTPGDLGFNPIQTSVGKLGVLVCWDQWYPEAARLMALQGADILIYPTAIGYATYDTEEEQQRQREAWTTVMRGHAVANGLPVVAVNRVGFEPDPSGQTEGIQFWGSSFVAGPQGELHYRASDKEEESLVVDIDLKHSEDVRRWWPFLRDRRIENYGDITRRFID